MPQNILFNHTFFKCFFRACSLQDVHNSFVFQLLVQNVFLTLNVPCTLHAFNRNVKTPVTLLHVAKMQNAKSRITGLFALVDKDMRAIPTPYVWNVSELSKYSFIKIQFTVILYSWLQE